MIKLTAVILLVTLCSCASDAILERSILANNIASNANLKKSIIKTDGFDIMSYSRISNINEPVTIYIEGDGFAWATRTRLSSNPTPRNPVALRLAALDDSANVIYIARPCQYTSFKSDLLCAPRFWSDSRFSTQAIESISQAIDELTNNKNINLVGYSGGAAIAIILAATRNDIKSIRTIAGNLDHVAINKHHRVDLLKDSLNPIDYATKISNIPQYHFSGSKDKIVPEFIAKNFAIKSHSSLNCIKVDSIAEVSHHKGWEKHWPHLLAKPLLCENNTANNNL